MLFRSLPREDEPSASQQEPAGRSGPDDGDAESFEELDGAASDGGGRGPEGEGEGAGDEDEEREVLGERARGGQFGGGWVSRSFCELEFGLGSTALWFKEEEGGERVKSNRAKPNSPTAPPGSPGFFPGQSLALPNTLARRLSLRTLPYPITLPRTFLTTGAPPLHRDLPLSTL